MASVEVPAQRVIDACEAEIALVEDRVASAGARFVAQRMKETVSTGFFSKPRDMTSAEALRAWTTTKNSFGRTPQEMHRLYHSNQLGPIRELLTLARYARDTNSTFSMTQRDFGILKRALGHEPVET